MHSQQTTVAYLCQAMVVFLVEQSESATLKKLLPLYLV